MSPGVKTCAQELRLSRTSRLSGWSLCYLAKSSRVWPYRASPVWRLGLQGQGQAQAQALTIDYIVSRFYCVYENQQAAFNESH